MEKCKEMGNKAIDLIFGRKRTLSIDGIVVGDEQEIAYVALGCCLAWTVMHYSYSAGGIGRYVSVHAADFDTGERFERRYQTLTKFHKSDPPYNYIFRAEPGANLNQLLELKGKTIVIRMKTTLPDKLIGYLMENYESIQQSNGG